MKGIVRKGQIWWSAGPLVGVTLLSIYRGFPGDKAIIVIGTIAAILSVPLFFIYPLYFKSHNRKYVLRSCQLPSNKGILGKHTIRITQEGFRERTDFNDTLVPWKGINRIETTKDHTFVFTSEIGAYIIPHRSLTIEERAAFVNEMNDEFQKAANQAL